MSDMSGSTAGTVARWTSVALACIVAGFLIGWFTRGQGGEATVLPPVTTTATTQAATGTTTAKTTSTAPDAAPQLPEPAQVRLAVLNGTQVSGFAAQTATRAEGLGYPSPSTGNAPTTTDPTIVYFRQGKRPAALRVAQDLGFSEIKALPGSGPVNANAPANADVVLVLGTGSPGN